MTYDGSLVTDSQGNSITGSLSWWQDGVSYTPILHLYQRYTSAKYQSFFFDFGEPAKFNDVVVLSSDSVSNSYMVGQDPSYDSISTTSFAILGEDKILVVKAILDSTGSYTMEIKNAMSTGWSTTNPVDVEKPNKMVYFVSQN
jgi:hypothetical protein